MYLNVYGGHRRGWEQWLFPAILERNLFRHGRQIDGAHGREPRQAQGAVQRRRRAVPAGPRPRQAGLLDLPLHARRQRAFWDSIKNSILASEYEAYLEQYPEGGFVALAQVRLEAIKQDAVAMRDPHDREIELSFWEFVRESDNPTLIQAYLEKYPNGEFSSLAQIRIGALTRRPLRRATTRPDEIGDIDPRA